MSTPKLLQIAPTSAALYAGEAPWHRLGTKLNEPATAREAIEASGLNYRVELKSLATTEGTAVPQRKGVVRSDTGDVLGVVGNSYIPVQNHQAFGFLDAIVAEGGLRYHTAGALGKGERAWMLAKLPSQIRVKGSEDLVDSRRQKPRSAHTVRGYMNSVLAALNWAYLQGWLPSSPRLRKLKTSKQKAMGGDAI